MLDIKVTKNEAEPAIARLVRMIAPHRVLKRALVKAEGEVRKGYSKKWFSQMLSKAGELQGKRGHDYTPGVSTWQRLKGEAGFHNTLGFFTGTTFRSISHRIVSERPSQATGEVSVYGKWPQVRADDKLDPKTLHRSKKGDLYRIGWFFTEVAEGYDIEVADSSSRRHSDEMNWQEDFEEDDFEILASGFQVMDDENSRGETSRLPVSRIETGGYISVGPGGAKIQYPNSTPFRKRAEEMRTKKYGPYAQGINFMYLTPAEERAVIGSVVSLISNSLTKL